MLRENKPEMCTLQQVSKYLSGLFSLSSAAVRSADSTAWEAREVGA